MRNLDNVIMTVIQKRKILKQIQETESRLEQMKAVRAEIAATGFASATMSSGSGSKSYTRLDLSKITEAIQELTQEIANLRSLLNGGSALTAKQIWTVYM